MSAADNRRITVLAGDRAVHRAFGWLHLNELQLRRWQMEFLAIAAPPFGETARARWFVERLHELGLVNAHLDAAGNALAELGLSGDDSAPFVLLSAHLDTVFPAGTDCTPREEAALLRGPGATDNGAGLTALLALAAALCHAKVVPACRILFAANVGEEGEGDLRGMRHIFSAPPYAGRIAAALALEGSGDATIVDRALASRRLRVTITGPGGHSWADAGRPNPIVALAAGIVAVSALKPAKTARTTLSWGTVRGGTSVNSIPESATADLDLRSTSAGELDRMELAALRALEEAVVAAGPLHLGVARIGDRPGGALAPGSALYGSVRAVDRHLNLVTEARLGSTDANLPLALGVPALAIGAGGTGGGIHTLDEWYDPTGRELAMRRVLLLLLDACTLSA